MMNVRSFRKEVREMASGQRFYLNAISASVAVVDQLRRYIKDGVVEPVREEVEKYYKDVEAVMSGKVILSQMEYIKK